MAAFSQEYSPLILLNEHMTEPGFACLMTSSNASVYTSRSARWSIMSFCPLPRLVSWL